MDAKRVELQEALDILTGRTGKPVGAASEQWAENKLRYAVESLQRIAALPEGWREKSQRSPASYIPTACAGLNRCADELQQALPEDMRK